MYAFIVSSIIVYMTFVITIKYCTTKLQHEAKRHRKELVKQGYHAPKFAQDSSLTKAWKMSREIKKMGK